MVRLENYSHILEIFAKLSFYVVLSVFGTLSYKVVQTWFVWHETWHTTLYSLYYCVEMVGLKNISVMLEITC